MVEDQEGIEKMDMEQIVMDIIISAGDARGYAYEALRKSKEADSKEVEIQDLMEKANEAIGKAHAVQTSLLNQEASEGNVKVSVLFVHAQDHLMTAISEKNLITELIEMRQAINVLQKV